MSVQSIAFFALAGIATVAALRIVTGRNLVHSIGFHVVTLIAISGTYGLLSAHFMAIVQVLVYVAAVTILLVFALMLTPVGRSGAVQALDHTQRGRAALTAVLLGALLLFVIYKTPWPASASHSSLSTEAIGRILLTTYALPFEIVSFLLLAALVGVTVVAAKHEDSPVQDREPADEAAASSLVTVNEEA